MNIPPSTKKNKVKTVANKKLPFLDMNISWSPEGGIQFGVFRKKGQTLNFVIEVSTHTPGTLYTIPLGFLNNLVKLTSHKLNFHYKSVDSVHPSQAGSLREVSLTPSVVPTMEKLWEFQDEKQISTKKMTMMSKKDKFNCLFLCCILIFSPKNYPQGG